MGKVILHAGMHETGSSSIQKTLHREILPDTHLYFALGEPNHSGPFVNMFSSNPEKYHGNIKKGLDGAEIYCIKQKLLATFSDQLKQLANRIGIVSAEDICNFNVTELSRIKTLLYSEGHTVNVVAYVRPPKSYIESAFQQLIKGGLSRFDPSQAFPNYSKLENLVRVFGRESVTFRVFNKTHLLQGDSTIDFLDYVGLSEQNIHPIRTNDSLSLTAVKALYVYRKCTAGYGVGDTAIPSNNYLINRLSRIGGEKFRIASPIISEYYDRSPEELRWVKETIPCATLWERNLNLSSSGIRSEDDLLHFTEREARLLRLFFENENMDFDVRKLNDLSYLTGLLDNIKERYLDQKESKKADQPVYKKNEGGYYQFEEAVYNGTMPMLQQVKPWSVDLILRQIDIVDCRDLSSTIRANLNISSGGYRSCISYLSSAQFSLEVLKQAIEHGGVTISCPLTGSAASSVGSVFFNGKNALRFHGKDVFYLIQDNFSAEILFYPLRKLAIVLPSCLRPEWKIRALLAKIRKYAFSYWKYFLSEKKEFGGVYCAHTSPFHYYYFKATPIARHWRETGRSFDIITQKGASFLDLSSVLGMPQSDKFIVETITDGERNVPIEVLEKKFYVSIGDRRGSMDLATATFLDEKVRDHSWYTQDSAALFEFSAADSDRPFVLWLGITTGKRRWLEEEKCYVQLIRWFARRHQKMLVIMDGWTRPLESAGDGNADNVYDNDKADNVYANDKYVAERIAEQVRGENVKVVYCMGRTAVDKVAMAKEVDFFCGNHSTGSIWVSRVAGRPGVTHVSNAARESVLRAHIHHNVTVVPSVYVSDICERDVMSKGHVSYSISVGDFLNIVAKKVREMEDGKGD